MRRSFAAPSPLALLLTLPMVNPPIAGADPGGPTLVGYQQSTSYVIQRALSQRNVPFLYGGGNAAGPTRGTGLKANIAGFDASGLIQYAYAGARVKMPRTSAAQPAMEKRAAGFYRHDLDGLRGIAIALVAMFHVWFGRVSGGVDVFLALSGFFFGGKLLRAALNPASSLSPVPEVVRL